MKLLTILLSLTVVDLIGGELNDFRWKQRILVVTSSSLSLRVNLVKDEVGLLERDVRVFILDDPEKAPSASLAAELKQRLKIRDGVDEVFLLGKDGRTILRWKAEEFTLSALFLKIDSMPMRKSEMQERREK